MGTLPYQHLRQRHRRRYKRYTRISGLAQMEIRSVALQMLALRNVLYNAERGLDSTFHHRTFYSTGGRIVEPSVEATPWSSWHYQCVETQYALFRNRRRVMLEVNLCESVLGHREIGSRSFPE